MLERVNASFRNLARCRPREIQKDSPFVQEWKGADCLASPVPTFSVVVCGWCRVPTSSDKLSDRIKNQNAGRSS
jgi:hypothetical protein